MPVFLNPTTWASFLSLFVRVVRHREPKLFDDWRRLAELIFAHLDHAHPNIAAFFAPVFLLRDCNELFKTLNDDELDPLVPAYHVVVNHWGKSLGCFYQIIADESKVLARERSRLLALSDPNLEPVSVGYDRRKMDYPLKASNIVAIDSTAHRQVQLADILSGAIANAAKARTKGSLEAGTFALDVFNLCFAKELIIDGLWPNHEVDPKALGTDIEPGADDVDLSTYTAMILGGHPITKRRSK